MEQMEFDFGEEPKPDIDKLVKAYVRMRDARSALKKDFDTRDEEIKVQMDAIEEVLLEVCKEGNMSSLGTTHGRVNRQIKTTYWVSDWDAMYKFLAESGQLDLLEKRIAQRNMATFLQENPDSAPPEGLVSESKYVIRVTRK